jgi:hypothetical protein
MVRIEKVPPHEYHKFFLAGRRSPSPIFISPKNSGKTHTFLTGVSNKTDKVVRFLEDDDCGDERFE